MATRQQREILKRAEQALLESMTDAELLAIIDSDPAFSAVLELLTDTELDRFISGLLTEDQVINIAASRTHPAESPTT